MSWLSKAVRGVGRGAKAYVNFGRKHVAPTLLTAAGTIVGGPAGGAVGSALGGAISRGRLNAGDALRDGAQGALMGGIGRALGMGGAAAQNLPRIAQPALMSTNPMTGAVSRIATGAATNAVAGAGQSALSQGIMSRLMGGLTNPRTISALSSGASAAAGMMEGQANRRLQERRLSLEEEELRRRREMEDRSSAALDPTRAALMQALARRFGLGV